MLCRQTRISLRRVANAPRRLSRPQRHRPCHDLTFGGDGCIRQSAQCEQNAMSDTQLNMQLTRRVHVAPRVSEGRFVQHGIFRAVQLGPRITNARCLLWTSIWHNDTSQVTHRRTGKCGEVTTPPTGGTIKEKTCDESWISGRQAFGLANKLTSILAGPTYSSPSGGGWYGACLSLSSSETLLTMLSANQE